MPRKKKLDEKTSKLLSDGEYLADLVKHPGWKVAKSKLMSNLIELNSISSMILDKRSDADIASEMRERASVLEIMVKWLNDIEGTVQNTNQIAEIMRKEQKDSVIVEFDN